MISDKELIKKESTDFFYEDVEKDDLPLFVGKLDDIEFAIRKLNVMVNNEHPFHPDNIFLFWDKWYSTRPDLRIIKLHENRMIQQLGLALCQFFVDALGAEFCYAVCNDDEDFALPAVKFSSINSESTFIPELVIKKGIFGGESLVNNIKDFIYHIKSTEVKITKNNLDEFIVWSKSHQSQYNSFRIWEYFFGQKNVFLLSLNEKKDLFVNEKINGKYWLSVFTDEEKTVELSKNIDKAVTPVSLTMKKFLTLIFLNENTNILGISVNNLKNSICDFDAPIFLLRMYANKFMPEFMLKVEEKLKSKMLKIRQHKIELSVEKNGNNEDDLWKSFFSQPNLYLISKISANPTPFIGEVEGRPSLFVFTSLENAINYAKHPNNTGFVDKKGDIIHNSLSIQDAIYFINDLKQFGVLDFRVDDPNGISAPIEDLPFLIRAYNENL